MQTLLQNHILAAESMHALPDIEVTIVEYSEIEHNRKNGIDRGLGRGVPTIATNAVILSDIGKDNDNPEVDESIVPDVVAAVSKKKEKKTSEIIVKEKEQMYYMVSCKDNGCGMYIQLYPMILDKLYE